MKACLKFCKVFFCILLIGLIAGLFSLTPFGTKLEENFGLAWLFKARGPIEPSDKIIIVSIDKTSAEKLQLSEDPEDWSRAKYAELITKLNQQKPALISLNIFFKKGRDPEEDHILAEAIANGRNIILSSSLKEEILPGGATVTRIDDPAPVLEDAALGSAPFPLPKTSSTVKQFWTHKSDGDITTLPTAVFQSFVFKQAYPEISQLLLQINPFFYSQIPKTFKQFSYENKMLQTIHTIESEFTNKPQTLNQLEELIKTEKFTADKQLLNAWFTMIKTPGIKYFNHYGNAGAIPSIPLYEALESNSLNPAIFHNKIILIGYSEDILPEKNLGLYTVFSKADGEITSHIELAATAIANLLDNTWLKPLQPWHQFILNLSWCLLLFGNYRLFSFKLATGLIILLNLGYASLAYSYFISANLWMPLFFPIILLTPLVLFIEFMSYSLTGRQQQKNIQQAFSLYIPDKVVNSLAQNKDINALNHFGELIPGACMATDAGQYTTLSESMRPENLNEVINDYYSVMFPPVKKHKGLITDIIGDAMFAVWAEMGLETQIRTNACLAALEIKAAVDLFNRSQPFQLPTRLGLHFGEIRLGNVGAADHYEYRAVGDAVNTTARIEELNKWLGTQILVSAEIIHDLPGFYTRDLGFFVLKGKTHPVQIYELLAITDQFNSRQLPVVSEFSKALKLFQQQQWKQAQKIWLDIKQTFPGDGPTLFYINYLEHNYHCIEQYNDNRPVAVKIGNITTSLAFKDVMRIE